MRIGIDMHTVTDFMQGTRTYTFNIIENLLKIDRENTYYLYINKGDNKIRDYFRQENVFFRHITPQQRVMRILVGLPIQLAADSIDVFHCQYMGPFLAKTPYVVMLHDIIHEYMPEYFPKTLNRLMRISYPVSAKRAGRILTVSEHSKNDIVKYYKIPEDKIIVTYDAVSDDFRPVMEKDKVEDVLKKYGIRGEYILYVGRLEPRKNLIRLLQAFNELMTNHNIRQKLVIVGMKYFQYEKLFELVQVLGLQDKVIFTGRVEDQDLPSVYNGATVFVYPSIAEGFGIPPLEAMACGVPVISSNTSSLPEVIGDAGILVDPFNVHDLAAEIHKVLSDKDLQKSMKMRGIIQAKKFSWETSARKTLMVCRELYEETIKRKTRNKKPFQFS